MGNTPSAVNPVSITSLQITEPLTTRKPRSEPNIFVFDVDNKILEAKISSNNAPTSLDKLQENQDPKQPSVPLFSSRNYCGSLEFDKPRSARGSRNFSLICEVKPVQGKLEQPQPDEMYRIGPDTPTRQDSQQSFFANLEDPQDIAFKWLVQDDDEHFTKRKFKDFQEKLRKIQDIQIKDIVQLDLISTGNHGKVYRAFHKTTREFYALKVVEVSTEHDAVRAWNEIKTLFYLQELKKGNLLKVYDFKYEQKAENSSENLVPTFSILMEFGKGTLKDYADFKYINSIPWDEDELENTLGLMLQQYSTLKTAGVFHGNIRPEHILIDQNEDKLIFAGYDSAYFIDKSSDKDAKIQLSKLENTGTMTYRAPEVKEVLKKNGKIQRDPLELGDLFSIGMSVLKICKPDLEMSFLSQTLADLSEEYPTFHKSISALLHSDPQQRKRAYRKLEEEFNRNPCTGNIVTQSDKYNEYIQSKALRMIEKEEPLTFISKLEELYLLKEAEAVADHFITAERANRSSNRISDLYYIRGLCLIEAGCYNRALEDFEKSYNIYVKSKGEDSLEVAKVFEGAARAYKSQKKYTEAYDVFKKALSIRSGIFGDQHNELAGDYLNIAQAQLCQGKYQEAESLLNKVYEAKKQAFGKNHFETAGALEGLGIFYKARGKYEQAMNLFDMAHGLKVKHYGIMHPAVGQSYHNIASVFEAQGKHEEALKLYKKALEIKEKCFGENHPEVALTAASLGIVYKDLGKMSEALKIYGKSLRIKIHFFGEDHPDVALLYHNIGHLYFGRKRYTEALEKFNKSYNINRRYHSENHPSVAVCYLNIGSVNQAQGNYPLAISNYKKALQILAKHDNGKNSDIALINNNMGAIYEKLGNHAQALEQYQQALKTKILIYGESHPTVAATYNNIGLAYEKQGKLHNALEMYENSLEIKRKYYGEMHSSMASTYHNVGLVYYKQEKYELALKIFEKSLDIKIHTLGANDQSIAEVYAHIGNVCRAQSHRLEAKRYYLKAIEIYQSYGNQKHLKITKLRKLLSELSM